MAAPLTLPVPAAAGGAGGSPPPPPSSSSKKTRGVLDVTKQFFSTKLSDIAKATYLTIDVGAYFKVFDKKDPVTDGIHYHAKLIKLAHAPGALIKGGIEWGEKTTQLMAEPSWSAASNAFFATNSLVNPVAEIAEFTTKAIWHLPPSSFHTLNGINGVSLTIGMGKETVDTVIGIADVNPAEVENKIGEITASLFRLAKAVSYVALGILITLSVFFEIVASPIVFTALSVNALVFSIMSFYYENITGNLPLGSKA